MLLKFIVHFVTYYKKQNSMINSAINEIDNLIYPPGTCLPDISIKTPLSSGEITFDNKFNQPLPSLVEAEFNGSAITVKTLIFVESQIPLEAVKIKQLFSISNFGNCKLQFFIYCSEEVIKKLNDDKESNKGRYKAYKIDFSTEDTKNFPKGISLENIKVVQTFVWNIDPETSRGTETVVKTSNT